MQLTHSKAFFAVWVGDCERVVCVQILLEEDVEMCAVLR